MDSGLIVVVAVVAFVVILGIILMFASLYKKVEQGKAMIVNTMRDEPKVTFTCLLYTSPSPRDQRGSRMPSSA